MITITSGKYHNILHLVEKHPSLVGMLENHGAVNKNRTLSHYLDNYIGSHPDIVERLLSDILDNYTAVNPCQWKVSRHREWRDQTITVQ